MAERVKFIDTTILKKLEPAIQLNVDDAILVGLIHKVQDVHLEQLLGSTYLNYLKAAQVAGTLTANERAMIQEFMQQMIASWVYYYAIDEVSLPITNKGVVEKSSEYSVPAELRKLEIKKDTVRNIADSYSSRLWKQINLNSSLYPNSQDSFSEDGLIKKAPSSTNGIYLKKSSGGYGTRRGNCCD